LNLVAYTTLLVHTNNRTTITAVCSSKNATHKL